MPPSDAKQARLSARRLKIVMRCSIIRTSGGDNALAGRSMNLDVANCSG